MPYALTCMPKKAAKSTDAKAAHKMLVKLTLEYFPEQRYKPLCQVSKAAVCYVKLTFF